MTIELRTATRWHDASDLVDSYVLHGTRLTVLMDAAAVRAARKDQSIAMCSQWRIGEAIYDTTRTSTEPARGILRVEAVREDPTA